MSRETAIWQPEAIKLAAAVPSGGIMRVRQIGRNVKIIGIYARNRFVWYIQQELRKSMAC